MSYSSKISEEKRSLVVLLIDQSGSMNELCGGNTGSATIGMTKAQAVTQAANRILMDIIARCKDGYRYKHYFDVCAIGYSGKGAYTLLPNSRELLSPAELASTVKRTDRISRHIYDPSGRLINCYESLKVWIEPYGEGNTPMCDALKRTAGVLQKWHRAQKYDSAFPPTIINITDGLVTDGTWGDVSEVRQSISTLGTKDGEPIFFNLHFTTNAQKEVLFPRNSDDLPQDAKYLYELSSLLPEMFNNDIAILKNDTNVLGQTYRAFSYNLKINNIFSALRIGTTTTNQIDR